MPYSDPEKKRAADRANYLKNKEKRKQKARNYYQNNPEKIKEYRNRPKVKAKKRLHDLKYAANHRPEALARSKAHYEKNRDQINKDLRERYATDDEYRKECIRRTRERLEENKDQINAQRRELHKLNPSIKREQQRLWREKNPNKVRQNSKRNYEKHRKSRLLRMKAYNQLNSENRRKYLREYKKLRKQIDMNFKFAITYCSRIRSAIKNQGGIKSHKSMSLIGCTVDYLIFWIEMQFTSDMNWDNHGILWHIDHIKPVSHFNLKNEFEQINCFHFSNMRPLAKSVNMSEGNRRTEDEIKKIKKEILELMISKGVYDAEYC